MLERRRLAADSGAGGDTTPEAGDRAGRTKAGRIAAELRAEIVAGTLPAGARLHQGDLAERFATSITPVREALRQLQAEGLLEGRSHRGVTVTAPDVERIKSVYVLRRLVEPYAARRAALRLSRQDFARARAINDELRRAQRAKNQLLARRLNRDFHFVFYEMCGLPTLVAEIERLWVTFPWSELHVVLRADSVREHERILDAVMRADDDEIEAALAEHLRHGYAAVMKQLGRNVDGDPFDVATPD
jgi:DNA-binding GntR family transcriptional regulator